MGLKKKIKPSDKPIKSSNKSIKSSDKPAKKRKIAPESRVTEEPVPKKNLAEQDLDDFLKGLSKEDGGSSDDESSDVEDTSIKEDSNNLFKKKKTKIEESSEDEGESSEADSEANAKSQKKYIKSLKKTDPEFLEHLKESGAQAILDAEESDSSDEENVHKPPSKLEEDSDGSDYEFEGEDLGGDVEEEKQEEAVKQEKITSKMVNKWTEELTEDKVKNKTIYHVVEAFRAAVSFIAEEDVGQGKPPMYKIKDSKIFNSVIRLCVIHINPAIRKFLGLKEKHELTKPRASKKFSKLKFFNKYLENLCVLVSRVSEPQVALVLIKHTYHMVPYFQGYGKGEKLLMKGVTRCWSEGADSVKVVALLCLVRLAKYMPEMQEPLIAKMHLAYVRNTKYSAPSQIPSINFMRRSLVEMYGLDHKVAYYQAFLQIRQLAIHLRTALTDHTPQHIQAVYNWQFIRSLELWGALIGHCSSSELIRELIYPLVQVIFGAIRLVKGNHFIPLRFHCATILTQISAETGTFIPVLPVYLDILRTINFKKKPKKASMKPLDFSCVLKVSKGEREQSGFIDAIVEQCYAGMLTYLAHNSNKIGFPELVTPMLMQLKVFIKTCNRGGYAKIFKQLIEKTFSNQKFIEEKRRGVNFGVGDLKEIEIWETKINRDGTPLLAFYTTWKKSYDTRTMMRTTSDIRIDGQYDVVPASINPHLKKKFKKTDEEREMVQELGFLSGSDDDIDDEERFKVKEGVDRPLPEGIRRYNGEDDAESLKSEDFDALEEGDNMNDDGSDAGDDFEMDSQDDSSGEEKDDDAESDDDGDDDAVSDAESADDAVEDQVKDLKLEDFDASESEDELKDDFGDASDDESDEEDGAGDDNDDDDDSD